ncbi:MAG: Uracil-DNA glycosylase [Mycoplasmataceae bacterium]|nr:MAG: Uracil-DNA glycosylase [Mycoplasmataceae bacterium]
MNNLWQEFNLDKIDPSWENFFQQESQKSYFLPLLTKISEEYKNHKCWPKKENIFRLFREISLDKIKVVILGQDPYHQSEIADGIAFSTQKSNYIPASLRNIFLELKQDLGCFQSTKSNLLPWVNEGVFLLNTALTVKDNQALSHMNWWRDFIYSLLIYLRDYNQKIIWILWGQRARKISEECQINREFCLISAHPSPYSAEHGFFGSRPFSKANQLLSEMKKEPINWLSII